MRLKTALNRTFEMPLSFYTIISYNGKATLFVVQRCHNDHIITEISAYTNSASRIAKFRKRIRVSNKCFLIDP